MTNEQIAKKLAGLPLIVRNSPDEVFKQIRELQEAARKESVSAPIAPVVDDERTQYDEGWDDAVQAIKQFGIEQIEALLAAPAPASTVAAHEHRWVGRGEYGDTSAGYMCADCGIDLDDTSDEAATTPPSTLARKAAVTSAAIEIVNALHISVADKSVHDLIELRERIEPIIERCFADESEGDAEQDSKKKD